MYIKSKWCWKHYRWGGRGWIFVGISYSFYTSYVFFCDIEVIFLDGGYTDKGLESIVKGFPNLEILKISSPNVTDLGISYISQHCPKLLNLVLNCPQITDAALTSISKGNWNFNEISTIIGCKKLASLKIFNGTAISQAGMVQVASGCTFLGALWVYSDTQKHGHKEISWENYQKVKLTNKYLPSYVDPPTYYINSSLTFVDQNSLFRRQRNSLKRSSKLDRSRYFLLSINGNELPRYHCC